MDLASLLIKQTKQEIFDFGIGIARSLGLPVTSWRPGDPTLSLLQLESVLLSTLEDVVAGYVGSAYLDTATGIWLDVLAEQVFGLIVPTATYASTSVTLTNAGGGVYTIAVGAVTFRNTTTGKTYRNTTGGTLNGLSSLTVTVAAEEAGSASSAAPAEIALVTGLLGVTASNATAAVGTDKQAESVTRQQCRDKLGALSPNGPIDAYRYVARNSALTGTTGITRVRVFGNSTTGQVQVYLAGPSGAISSPDRTLVEAAIAKWATPICITPVVSSAVNVVVPVTYTLWVYSSVNKTSAQIQTEIATALGSLFASRDIGGDIIAPALTGALYKSLVESTIRGLYPQAFRVTVSLPAADVALANNEVAVLGTITPTINLVSGP
jgi:uncharacterized phage protein gp47/JayE